MCEIYGLRRFLKHTHTHTQEGARKLPDPSETLRKQKRRQEESLLIPAEFFFCPHKSPVLKGGPLSPRRGRAPRPSRLETLSGSAGKLPSGPISCRVSFFLCLLLLIPAGGIRRSGASVIAPRAHRGVLSHTEIHISASFNLGCGSLSHIYDCG